VPESALNGAATAIPRLVDSVLKAHAGLPAVTVSWAQSADGAIAPFGGKRAVLSGRESMVLTHQLRSLHRGILVGIGTVLADDPQLTVRLVDGPSPQPVVLDSQLRFPDSARLLSRTDLKPWIFHANDAPAKRARELSRRGARLFPLPVGDTGLPVGEVLRALRRQGIESLMVEGGARVLHSFISGCAAHQAVITVSPVEMGGLRIFESDAEEKESLDFSQRVQEQCGPDLVIWGRLKV